MEKKITIGVFLLVVLIIINAVIGSVLIFFIQDIREPKIDVEFNLSQLTTDEMRFTARISMENDNQFDLLIKNLNIIGKTTDGIIILDIEFTGGRIAAKQQRMFSTNETVSFSGDLSSKIYGSIQGIFGVNLAGVFEKTIPFQINITASFQDLFNNISSPKLSLLAEVTEITGDGVLFQGMINVENPNFFEMSLENFTTRVETEKGESVGEISKLQGKILPNTTSQFAFNGILSYDALNAKILILRFRGNAGVHVIGIDKTIELSTMAQIPIPDIKELLFHNESLGITISLDVKVRVRGFLTTIGLTLYNPSKIPLQANDLLCSIYGLTGGHQKMIAQKSMEPTSVEPIEVDYLEAQLLVPYIKIFTSGTKKIFPDWFVIQIEGNFSLVGVNQSIPVSINATINPHLLRS
jgi:LEA14-like dessication related protein